MIKDLLDIQLDYSLHGNFEEGWKIIQQLQKERFWCNRVKFNSGWYYLRNGNMKKGMELINQGRFERVFGNPPINSIKPIYDGRLLNNENIIFNCEGGFGDEFIGIRFCKEIKDRGGNCFVICHPQLKSVFERVDGVVKVLDKNVDLSLINHSFWVPSMASELILNHTFETIPSKPYINSKNTGKFKTIVNGNKLKVGIKWSGNPEFEHEQYRIFPPELMFESLTHKDVQLYSLQIEHDLTLPENVIDLRLSIKSWEDSIEIIDNLDLVVTSCTGLAHLSAALGKTTWIIVPILSYYIWAFPKENDKSTWYYDSARLFRQEKYGSWIEPFNKIKSELDNYVKYNF